MDTAVTQTQGSPAADGRMGGALGSMARAAFYQLINPAREKRSLIMLGVFLFSSWIAMDAYHILSVQGLPVALVDYDNSQISRKFASILMDNRTIQVSQTHFDNLAEAKSSLESGRHAAILLIPEKFSREIRLGKTAHIALYIDGSNILVSKNIKKAILKSSIVMGIGIGIVKMRHLGIPEQQAMARAMPIKIEASNNFNPTLNYGVYIVPGLLFFLLQIYLTLLTAGLYQRTLFQGSFSQRLGRLCGIFCYIILLALMFYYLWLPYLHLQVHSSFFLVLSVTALFVVTNILFVIAIHKLGFFRTTLAMDVSVLLAMLSLTLSGITWPTDMFPRWIAALSYALPFRPFAQAFQVFIHGEVSFAEIAPYSRALLLQGGGYLFIILVMSLIIYKRNARKGVA